MSENIQRTPEQLARLAARAARKEQVDKLDADIATLQAQLDGHNQDMLRTRDLAIGVQQQLDVLKAHKGALLSPIATAPESEVLDETISVSE